MVEDPSVEECALLQRHRLDPGTPHPQKLEANEPPDDESVRDKRRREWQTAKIEQRRAKQRRNRSTNSVASGSLTDACSTVAETCSAPLSAYFDRAADLENNRPHDRTLSQWKTILELQLCAGCLTRTIPPHKPKDERAPCKDLPSVTYDEVYITAIRKELAREEPLVKRKGNGNRVAVNSGGRKQQRSTAHGRLYGDNRTLQSNLQPNAQHGPASPSQYSGPPGRDVHEQAFHAPLYNFPGSSSCSPYRTIHHSHGRHNVHPGTGSQSSITLEDPEGAELIPGDPRYSKVLHPVNTQPVTPRKQSSVDHDILGLTPATPLIPEIHIEDEAETVAMASHRVRLFAESDISSLMPLMSNVDRDWDSETHVPEPSEQAKVQDPIDGNLNSSRLLVEKLMGEARAMISPVERSWTLKGLCPSPVSHSFASIFRTRADVAQNCSEWDDATMVEEPHELSLDFDSFSDKVHRVLRTASSAESFFATRQCTY